MEKNMRNKTKGYNYPTQEFNWKIFKLYPWERYYSWFWKRMHEYVWEYYNWKIYKWFQIHHKNKNTFDNDIKNLEIKTTKNHLSEHFKEYYYNNKEKVLKHLENVRHLTKDWHKSEEWINWHREHAKKCSFWKKTIESQNVLFVEKNLLKKQLNKNFATTIVNQNIGEKCDLITLFWNVNIVDENIQKINIQKNNFVEEVVLKNILEIWNNEENVFDLMVENKHEYFANWILVHNCLDWTRYLLSYWEKKEFYFL